MALFINIYDIDELLLSILYGHVIE